MHQSIDCRAVAWLVVMMVVAGACRAEPAAMVSSGFIYNQAPYPQCHASTIVEPSPGKLLAAWFGGTRERAPDVCIYVARLEDGRWLEPVQVADGVQPDGSRVPTWNPVLFQPPDGPLHLFYKVGPAPRAWWGMVATSYDSGATWNAPRRLPEGVFGPIKNKPIITPDGAWLSGSSTEAGGWRVHFERSTDSGKTWQIIGPIDRGDEINAIQPSILRYGDGWLQALCRSQNGVIAQTWSRDNGQSWSALEKTDLPNPNSGTDAVTLADGRQLLVYNHSAPPPERPTKGVRYPLDIALSTDGKTWKHVMTLESEPIANGYAYPAVIQAADGLVHVTYTFDRKRIKHVVIDPKRL